MTRTSIPPYDRLMSKVVKSESGCWLWTGHTVGSKSSYGRFRPSTNSRKYVHRWMYEHSVALIPPGYEVDHLCFEPLCVNPEHLEAVSPEENQKRRRSRAGIPVPALRQDNCKNGHDLTDPNNCRWDDLGRRRGCIVCHRENALRRLYLKRDGG